MKSSIQLILMIVAGIFSILTGPASGAPLVNVKCAVVQYTIQDPNSVGVDDTRLAGFVRQAANNRAKIIVCPETIFYRYCDWNWNDLLAVIGQYNNLKNMYSALADELNVCIVIGLREPSGNSREPNYNTALFFGPDGALLGKHRKMVPSSCENSWTLSGSESNGDATPFTTPYGRVGMLICKDMDNNTWPDKIAAKGMDLHIGINGDPTRGWTKVKRGCTQAKCYGIGANCFGGFGSRDRAGNSGFVGPDGNVISQAGQGEKTIYETLPLPYSGGTTGIEREALEDVKPIINLAIKDKTGLQSGPWLSSMETGDTDTKWRPEIYVYYKVDNGTENVKSYKRPIGGNNPLVYYVDDKQGTTNYYDTMQSWNSKKAGDSMLIKRYRNRVGFIQCDISNIPLNATITKVVFKGHVHPQEGRSSDGTLIIHKMNTVWKKYEINPAYKQYIGTAITELPVQSNTFVKGSDWWVWNWDARLVNYVQQVLFEAQNTQDELAGGRMNKGFEITALPNPFHTRTDLRISGLIKPFCVSIYDITGRKITEFANLASNTIMWNPSGLASGVYMVKAQFKGKTYVKKILLKK